MTKIVVYIIISCVWFYVIFHSFSKVFKIIIVNTYMIGRILVF